MCCRLMGQGAGRLLGGEATARQARCESRKVVREALSLERKADEYVEAARRLQVSATVKLLEAKELRQRSRALVAKYLSDEREIDVDESETWLGRWKSMCAAADKHLETIKNAQRHVPSKSDDSIAGADNEVPTVASEFGDVIDDVPAAAAAFWQRAPGAFSDTLGCDVDDIPSTSSAFWHRASTALDVEAPAQTLPMPAAGSFGSIGLQMGQPSPPPPFDGETATPHNVTNRSSTVYADGETATPHNVTNRSSTVYADAEGKKRWGPVISSNFEDEPRSSVKNICGVDVNIPVPSTQPGARGLVRSWHRQRATLVDGSDDDSDASVIVHDRGPRQSLFDEPRAHEMEGTAAPHETDAAPHKTAQTKPAPHTAAATPDATVATAPTSQSLEKLTAPTTGDGGGMDTILGWLSGLDAGDESDDDDDDGGDGMGWRKRWARLCAIPGGLSVAARRLLTSEFWAPLRPLAACPVGQPDFADRIAGGQLHTAESEALIRLIYRDLTPFGRLGQAAIGTADRNMCELERASPLYGEVLPEGVTKLLGPKLLAAGDPNPASATDDYDAPARASSDATGGGTTMLDLGCGLGRFAVQAFCEEGALEHVVGIELTSSRAALGAAALERLFRYLARARFARHGTLKGLHWSQTEHCSAIEIARLDAQGAICTPMRRLALLEQSLFDVPDTMLARADVVILATEFSDTTQLCRVRDLLGKLRQGTRLLSYKPLEDLYPAYWQQHCDWHVFARAQKYRTSWASNEGHHFHLALKSHAPPSRRRRMPRRTRHHALDPVDVA